MFSGVALAAVAMGGAAHAQVDPAYTKVGLASQVEQINSGFGTYSSPGVGGGAESVSIQGSPFPSTSVRAVTDPDSLASGIGYITYDFAVVGSGSATVDLQAATSLAVSVALTGDSYGGASAQVTIGDGSVTHEIDLTGAGATSWSGTLPFTAQVGFLNYLTIQATAYTSGTGHGGDSGVATAYADPYITFVGPHDGYSLVFSPGVGNAAAAPEPATWGMLLVGFGAIGLTARRRASRPASA